MTEKWWQPLSGDPMRWLLEDDDPSIVYFFLLEIAERPNHSLALQDARLRIRSSPAVRAILSRQHPDGWWETPDHLTEPRYTATLWQLYLLAELGMTGQDFRVATAADFVLETFMTPEGDFTLTPDGSQVNQSVAGLLLWSLHQLGYAEDERVRFASERMTRVTLAGGELKHAAGPPSRLWAGLPVLWAISAIPPEYRSNPMEALADQGADAFLEHALPAPPASALQLSFPNYDPQDILYALRVLTSLGYGSDPRLQPGLAMVIDKQLEGGRWPLERAFQNAGLNWGPVGHANRWVTLNVLRVLKAAYDGQGG